MSTLLAVLACCALADAQAKPAKKKKLWKPKVALSHEHEQTCLIKVGDTMPALQLPDTRGQNYSVQQNLGTKFTVVVFWNSKRLFSREQFRRMQKEVADPWSKKGVNVVAINVGENAAVVNKLITKYGAKFPVLIDSQSTALKKVASGDVPRIFLLDAKGKVLWFDIEYSKGATLNLNNAIEYYGQPDK